MKLIVGCLLAAMLLLSVWASAQNKLSEINGTVVTDHAKAADAATVLLLRMRDSSVVKIAVCDKKGLFTFADIAPGNYLFKFTKIGYAASFYGPVELSDHKNLVINTIVLQPAIKQLNEVAVTAKKEYVQIRSNKTVLNVDQNIGAAGNSVFDVLKTAPGVKVVGDQILYKAGLKPLIAINGKVLTLTEEQTADLLKSYASGSISQVELIQNPSAKYDAAGAGGVINIILKKNKDLGTNISVTQSGSLGDRNQSGTLINLNARTSKLNIYASYNFLDGKSTRTFSNDRTIIADQRYDFNLDYRGISHYLNHNFSLGADYLISDKQTLGMLISGYHNSSTIDKFNTTDIFTNGVPDSSIEARSNINRVISAVNYNLNYKGSFGKSGLSTLSSSLDYSDYNRRSLEYLTDLTHFPSGNGTDDLLQYRDQSPSHIQIWSGKIDFSQQISKSSSLDAGAKISQTNSYNNLDFDQLYGNQYLQVIPLTDNFVYTERINAGYLAYNLKLAGAEVALSVRGEQTSSDAVSANPSLHQHEQYFDLFPKVLISRELNQNNQLSLSFARSILRPNYQDLNPFIGYVDQFYHNTGNPFLKPEYIDKFDVSDFMMHTFKVTLSMVVTNNFFTNIWQQDNITKVYTSEKSNIANRYQYIAEFDVPVTPARWWSINFNLLTSYERYHYLINYMATKSTLDFHLTADQSFRITKKLSGQVYGEYEAPTYFGISQYQSFYFLDAGLKYAVLGNNGSVTLAYNDVFNTNNNRYHSNYLNLDLNGKDKFPNRYINATFTYRFGKKTLKSPARHKTGNDDEYKRLRTDSQ
jgi:hypothetical protein